MRFDILVPNNDLDETGDQMVVISHRENSLYWNMASRTINTSKEEEMGSNIFIPLNLYLNTLDAHRQDKLFEQFQLAHQVFTNLLDTGDDDVEMIARKLRPILARIFDMCPEPEVFKWTWYGFVPGIPDDVKHEFTSDMPGTPERTYLVEDLRNLIPVAIISRLAFPIITEYIHSARDELGKLFKESTAFTLLYETWVYRSVAMRRLSVFVTHTIGSDIESDNAIMSGIGSGKLVEWVLAFLVIRRLMKVDVRANTSPSVASTLFHAITTRMRQIMTSGRNIKIKKYQESSSDGDNNLSILENFRTKEEMTIGDLSIFREYIRRQTEIALNVHPYPEHSLLGRMDSTIPPELIKECYDIQVRRKNYEYKPVQVILVMWIVSDYISPAVAPYITRGNIVALIAIVQAYFIHRGNYDLAVLAGASYRVNVNDQDRTVGDSAIALPKQLMAVFQTVFPYTKNGGFEGGSSRTKVLLPQVTIDDYIRALKSYEITPQLPMSCLGKFSLDVIPRVYNVPKNIRIIIAEALIEIATRQPKVLNWDTLQMSQSSVGNSNAGSSTY